MKRMNAQVVSTPEATLVGSIHAALAALAARMEALEAAKAAPKGPKAAPKGTPEWIVHFGAKKAARRRLAAEMRAKRIPITEASWAAAKREAGIA